MPEPRLGCALMSVDFHERVEVRDAHGPQDTQAFVGLSSVRTQDIARRHGGVEIEARFGYVVFRFPTTDDAIRASCDIYDLFDSNLAVGHAQILYKIGIHYEEPESLDAQALAVGRETAQRIAECSRKRQILMSEAAVEHLSPVFQARVFDSALALDGGEGTAMALFEIVCNQEDVTHLSGTDQTLISQKARLLLSYEGETWNVNAQHPVLMAGRGEDCDLIVHSSLVSRFHARFEFRQGRFVVVDQSKNGTLVELPGDKRVFIKHQELVLRGSGSLSLGENPPRAQSRIGFVCEGG